MKSFDQPIISHNRRNLTKLTMKYRTGREWMLFRAGPSLPFGHRLTVSLSRRGIFLLIPISTES
jgi:hypothetical protein